jgi:energy-coupling factor transporter ATP-binding protein EcfA2
MMTPKRADTIERGLLSELIPGLFHNSDGTAFSDVYRFKTRYTYPIHSKQFAQWLQCYIYNRCQVLLDKSQIGKIVEQLEILAQFAPQAEIYGDRIIQDQDTIYINVGDERGGAIAIKKKSWDIITNPPVRFKTSQFIEPLPLPVKAGKIEELLEITNLNPEQLILVAGWLLGTLNPNPPYPLLIITGEQGSGKSSLARMLKQLIDPGKGVLRSQPKDERSLMVAAMNAWVLCFDNFSKLSQSLSDALCRLSTGNSHVDRKLYSDGEQTVIEAARPVIITSIVDTVTNGDLLDRSICIHLDPILPKKRLSEKDINTRFEELKPRILGLLCTAVSQALANRAGVNLEESPRMADFAEWVTAAEPALGFEAGTFLQAYQTNREQSQRLTVEDSPVALAIQSLLERESCWQGTATELLKFIKGYAIKYEYSFQDLPKAANKLSGQLRKINPGLRAVGLEVNFERQGKSGTRVIKIEKIAS